MLGSFLQRHCLCDSAILPQLAPLVNVYAPIRQGKRIYIGVMNETAKTPRAPGIIMVMGFHLPLVIPDS